MFKQTLHGLSHFDEFLLESAVIAAEFQRGLGSHQDDPRRSRPPINPNVINWPASLCVAASRRSHARCATHAASFPSKAQNRSFSIRAPTNQFIFP